MQTAHDSYFLFEMILFFFFFLNKFQSNPLMLQQSIIVREHCKSAGPHKDTGSPASNTGCVNVDFYYILHLLYRFLLLPENLTL